MSANDCYNSLVYPIFLFIYIVLFCFLFIKKLEVIVLISLFVLTFFLLLKIYLDIFFFLPTGAFSIINKSISFDFIKKNSILYVLTQPIATIPTYVYLFLSIVLTTSSLLILLVIMLLTKRSGLNNDTTLSIPMSNFNGKKLLKYKTLFVIDIVCILLSAGLLTYVDSSTFNFAEGRNVANQLLIISVFSSIVLSAYLLKLSNDFYGIQQQIADGSGKSP